jgi:hypothetical protein
MGGQIIKPLLCLGGGLATNHLEVYKQLRLMVTASIC